MTKSIGYKGRANIVGIEKVRGSELFEPICVNNTRRDCAKMNDELTFSCETTFVDEACIDRLLLAAVKKLNR